jgi:uncharacterized OB-fold protein
MTAERPRPVLDLQTEPYWQGLRRKVLLVQFCEKCSVHVHPSKPCCPQCLGTDLRWTEVTGAGVVVGYCTVAQPFVGLAAPYDVVRVSLLDAPEVLLVANLTGRPASAGATSDIPIGARVDVVYEVVDDDLVLAQFELAASGA